MLDPLQNAANPFAVLTFIVAPALLTNASTVLALSTINRMLRTRERMQELFALSEKGGLPADESARLVAQVDRVEKQALLLLGALHAIYIAIGSFASATLVTLLGATVASQAVIRSQFVAAGGLTLGFMGVSGLVFGTICLFRATRLSVFSIRDEASLIRARQRREWSAESGMAS